MAEHREEAVYPEDHRPSAMRGFIISLIVVLTGAAALAAYWTMTSRPLPEQLQGDLASADAMAAYGVIALILLGALVFVFLVGRALSRAFSPDYSGPYRVYLLFTLVAAMISGYTTTYGVTIEFLDPAQGFIRYRLFPVVVFLYAFLFVYLTWTWTFDLVIRQDHEEGGARRNRFAAAFLIPLLAAVPIFAVSTTTSALGLAGPRILERSVLGWMDDYTRSTRSLEGYIQDADSVALSLESLSTRMETLAGQEAATGAISGYAGAGSVVNQLNNASGDLQQTAGLVMREQQARLETVDVLANRLDGARARVLEGDFFQNAQGEALPVRDWQDRVRGLERELGGAWESASSRSHIRAASGQLDLLDGIIFGGAMSASSTVADAQRDARGQISSYLGNARGTVKNEMNRALADAPPEPPEFTYTSPLLVLFNSWEQAILPWIIAIAVDFGPWVWIMLALIAGFDERSRSRARYAHAPAKRQGSPYRSDRDDGPEGDEETRKRRKDEPLLAPGAKRNGNGSGLTRH